MLTRSTAVQIARYGLALFFFASGVYCLLAAAQSASFSVPAQPQMAQIYITRATLLLPISLLMFGVGALFLICLRPGSQQRAE